MELKNDAERCSSLGKIVTAPELSDGESDEGTSKHGIPCPSAVLRGVKHDQRARSVRVTGVWGLVPT